ncbi:MAG: calcium-binding protein [Solirubrobacterales bacterium]
MRPNAPLSAPRSRLFVAKWRRDGFADSISGGGVVAALDGNDEVHGDDTHDLVCGGEGDDRIESEIGITLEYGDDVYLGGAGDDKLRGGSRFGGSDKLVGGAGRDRISGNGGRDRISGGKGRDRLSGDNARDRITGGKGNDVLKGGKGDDILKGGKGRDVCIGGGGHDRASGCERTRKL